MRTKPFHDNCVHEAQCAVNTKRPALEDSPENQETEDTLTPTSRMGLEALEKLNTSKNQ